MEVFAADPLKNPAISPELQTKTGEGFLRDFFPSAVGVILVVGVLIFFFMLLIGAVAWISSGGDKSAVETARNRISSALIGLVVMFSVFVVINFIENFFGVNILSIDIGPLKIQ